MSSTPGDARPVAPTDTRRNLLRKAAVGGAVAFAAPTILTRTAAAAASDTTTTTTNPPPAPCVARKVAMVRFRGLGDRRSEDRVRLGLGDVGQAQAVNPYWVGSQGINWLAGDYDFSFSYDGGRTLETSVRRTTHPIMGTSHTVTFTIPETLAVPLAADSVEVIIKTQQGQSTVALRLTAGPVVESFGTRSGDSELIRTFGAPAQAPRPNTPAWAFGGAFRVADLDATQPGSAERNRIDIVVGTCFNPRPPVE